LVSYDDRTKEVTWEIGRIPAGAGVIMSAYELIFQIGLTPSINQVGQLPVLINESTVEGRDTFTNNNLTATSPAVNTSVPDDLRVGYGGGVVAQ
jgi:hypothetical protein